MALKGEAKKKYQREYMRQYMRDRRLKAQLLRPNVKTSEIDADGNLIPDNYP